MSLGGAAGSAIVDLVAQVLQAGLGVLDQERRLYRLEGAGDAAQLLVETWAMAESLSAPWTMHLSCLSQNPRIDPGALLGQRMSLLTTLANGSQYRRSGLVFGAEAGTADGGLARYQLELQPWLGLLNHNLNSRVWQERGVLEILQDVLGAYASAGDWQVAPGVEEHLARSPRQDTQGRRSYVVQYRQTDLAFVQRLLCEEGLLLRIDPQTDTVHIVCDTTRADNCPLDTSAAQQGGQVRFHRDDPTETQDTVQALHSQRLMPVHSLAAVGTDYKSHRVVSAELPGLPGNAGAQAPELQDYADLGAYPWSSQAQADRALALAQEAIAASHKTWHGRGTVRSFAAGGSFELVGSPLDTVHGLASSGRDHRRFVLTAVVHAGINNLPKALSQALAGLAQAPGGKHARSENQFPAWVGPTLRQFAAAGGYANAFTATRRMVPWRMPGASNPTVQTLAAEVQHTQASLSSASQDPPRPAPRLQDLLGPSRAAGPAPGLLTASVVGEPGQAPGDLHQDALGRLRICFDFQNGAMAADGGSTSRASTWVRMAQTWAGTGHGSQHLPRVGQQVLVDFIAGDIERPVIVAALYDGRGEAGVQPTPGGQPASADFSALARSTDHSPSAQGNLAAAGHAPSWHGSGAQQLEQQGQRNPAALSGVKTQELQGSGYNQLVFDDSDQQLRTQLATTQHASQLNLGHLVHQADNHRGSFRGQGFELRTDAYGALRAGGGVLITTANASAAEPAGDNAPGMALARHLATLGKTFSGAASVHQTTTLAAHLGTFKTTASAQANTQAPLQAIQTALQGMVSALDLGAAQADAQARKTAPDREKVPHSAAAMVVLQGQAGTASIAGHDQVHSAGHSLTESAGQDMHQGVGGDYRLHTGQSIGVLAGAVKAGGPASGTGLSFVAATKNIQIQAQSDRLQVAAKQQVSIQSRSAHVDWAAAKKITLAVAGGASLTIQGGNIVVECPGKITVNAGKKSFSAPEQASCPLPTLPKDKRFPIKAGLKVQDIPGAHGIALVGEPWQLVVVDSNAAAVPDVGDVHPTVFNSDHWIETLFSGSVAAGGKILLTAAQQSELFQRVAMAPRQVFLICGLRATPLLPARWNTLPSQTNSKQILDALNFAADGRRLDKVKQRFLEEVSIKDANVRGMAQLKSKTQA